jgi:hypothetical protein
MGTKAHKAVYGLKLHTADTVVALINALPASERIKLFEALAGHPDNKPAKGFARRIAAAEHLVRQGEKMRNLASQVAGLEAIVRTMEHRKRLAKAVRVVNTALKQLEEALARLQDSVPKRDMTPANCETLELYHMLLKKHGTERGGQIRALRELVTLPSEQEKGYVRNYRESCGNGPNGVGDMEAVRQHVKRLLGTARKRHESRLL